MFKIISKKRYENLIEENEVLRKELAAMKEIKGQAYKEFAEEFEKRCVASGIYPAVTKNILKKLVKELTEQWG